MVASVSATPQHAQQQAKDTWYLAEQARAEAKHAKEDAEQARAEAKHAKEDAEQARAKAKHAKDAAEQVRAEAKHAKDAAEQTHNLVVEPHSLAICQGESAAVRDPAEAQSARLVLWAQQEEKNRPILPKAVPQAAHLQRSCKTVAKQRRKK
ncbi:aspartic and glutamic acid-rich protein-like [Liolophura sinensis]|uniref:aspartic and glutamic acid-rich protein-like n=1 Tax=Liolophura sinensis TaxID=3198878 RepID=UPI0031591B4D